MTRFIPQYLLWLVLCTPVAFADEPRLYTGAIDIPTLGELEMTLGIVDNGQEIYILLTVPSQGALNIPLKATHGKDGSIVAQLKEANLSFSVFENEDCSILSGEMYQGLTFPIDFKRVDIMPTLQRQQTPEAPFPYKEREITALHSAGFLLQGTLTIPDGEGPYPCAVLISGSGQQDRDESILGHKPFLVIADFLTRNGIAVLRYDDRGVGGSVVEDIALLQNATTEDFASDAAVMVHAARLHPEIDPRRVGVIGHSEGGIIGPMVAINDDALSFVVLLAGPGVPGHEILLLQQSLILKSQGATDEQIDRVENASLSMYELLDAGASYEEVADLMVELSMVQLEVQGISVNQEEFNQLVLSGQKQLFSPWMKYFLFYDPAPTIAAVDCPILAMNGSLDLQVDSRQNLPVIAQSVEAAGGNITIAEFENLNHLFQPTNTGAISEYGQIDVTFDEQALEYMTVWLQEVTDED